MTEEETEFRSERKDANRIEGDEGERARADKCSKWGEGYDGGSTVVQFRLKAAKINTTCYIRPISADLCSKKHT